MATVSTWRGIWVMSILGGPGGEVVMAPRSGVEIRRTLSFEFGYRGLIQYTHSYLL
jgi:hypothetical protein